MSIVWQYFNRGGSEKLVLLALADWANDEGASLHPSMAAIARKSCISVSQARRIVHGFLADGLLEVLGNAAGGAPGTTPHYRLKLDRLASGDPEAVTNTTGTDASPTPSADARSSADATPRTGARDALHGCASTASTGASQSVSTSTKNHHSSMARARAAGKEKYFELAVTLYPAREGGSSKAAAWKAWKARLRDGVNAADLIAGIERYAVFVQRTGKAGTQFVKCLETFLGPHGHFRQSWEVTAAGEAARRGVDKLDAWWTSDAGVERKGRELGIEARKGEAMASYRDRIRQRCEQSREAA